MSVPASVNETSGTVIARLAVGEAVNVDVNDVEPPLTAIAIINPYKISQREPDGTLTVTPLFTVIVPVDVAL